MSLRHQRARPRFAAIAVVLLASFCSGPLVLPHVDALGDVDHALPVAHDESSHRLGSDVSREGGHPQHCLLCHWIRAFSALSPIREEVHQGLDRRERLGEAIVLAHHRTGWPLVPGRAPPA